MALTKTIQATVKNRTDTAANWTQKNPVLAEGEIIVVQTSARETRLKIGDGVKTFTQLPYTDEQIYNNVVTSVNGQTGDVTLDIPGGAGTLVQSDWNQNDETASDYIKNRPFYNKKAFEDIIWDGVIGNKESQHVEETTGSTDYVLVSNEVISSSALIGAKIVLSSGDEVICTSSNIHEGEGSITVQFGDTTVLIIRETTDENAFIIQKKGIYFTLIKRSNATTYTSKLVSPENLVKLDSNYLPTATTTSIGAIKIGNGLSISDDGTLSVTTATYYTGTADPVNTLGADGDLYLKTEG